MNVYIMTFLFSVCSFIILGHNFTVHSECQNDFLLAHVLNLDPHCLEFCHKLLLHFCRPERGSHFHAEKAQWSKTSASSITLQIPPRTADLQFLIMQRRPLMYVHQRWKHIYEKLQAPAGVILVINTHITTIAANYPSCASDGSLCVCSWVMGARPTSPRRLDRDLIRVSKFARVSRRRRSSPLFALTEHLCHIIW